MQDYNTLADRLQMIPTTAKRAGGMQFEARLNRSGSSSVDVVNVDLKVSLLCCSFQSRDWYSELKRTFRLQT